MKSQKIIPFPRAKISKPAGAAPPSPAGAPGSGEDVGALLEALLESHRLGQATGAVLSLRTGHREQLYLVGEYAADLPAAIRAVRLSLLTIAARQQLAELHLMPTAPK
ncbi:MAG: hypothetical protein ABI790_02455 [Betaproteobacteria bacterium]